MPTFRGPEGLWRTFRPEELATPEAFRRDPRLVWEFYAWRRERIAACRPNPAHRVLARWSRTLPGFTLVTQNVDGLHEAAGARNVLRLHGSLWELRCTAACPSSPPSWEDRRVPLPELPPPCPECGALARPAVVWFGEALDPAVLAAALRATSCDVFLAVGTSAVVWPAAALVPEAARRGAFTVEVNPEPSAVAGAVDLALTGPAEEILPELDRRLAS